LRHIFVVGTSHDFWARTNCNQPNTTQPNQPTQAEFFEVDSKGTPNAVVSVNEITAECSTNRNFVGKIDDYDERYSQAPGIDCRGNPDFADGCDTVTGYDQPNCAFEYVARAFCAPM
jgi:hypothetical protein